MKSRATLLAGLVLLLTASAMALSWWQNRQSQEAMRQELLAQTERRSLQLADAMAGQVDGLLGTLDLALRQLREAWDGDPLRFDPVARRVLATLPPGAVSHVSIVDERGYVIYDSLGGGREVYVGDREHNRLQDGRSDLLRIGTPVRSRIGEGWTVIVNRVILRNGQRAGIVNLNVRADHFAGQLKRLGLGAQDVVALVDGQGRFVARSLDHDAAMGRHLPPDRPFLTDPTAAQGRFRVIGQTDGVPRVYGWRRLPGAGLVVAVGLAEAGELAPLTGSSRRDQRLGLGLLALLGLFGALLAVLLLRAGRQQVRLAASETFRRRLFDSSRVAIGVMDPASGRFIDCNPAAASIYGLADRTAVIGLTPADVSAPTQAGGQTSASAAAERISEVLREGSAVFEWRHQRPDGKVWEAEVHLMRFDDDGRPLLQFTLQDITERRRAERALQLTQAAVDGSRDAVFWVDDRGRTVRVNTQACHSLGRTESELVGRAIWDFDPDFAPERWPPLMNRMRRDGAVVFETRHRRSDGTVFPVEITASEVPWEGRIYGFCYARDITDRKHAEEALHRANEELERRVLARTAELRVAKDDSERANLAKSEFLSRMSHELRTPLNAILGFGQLLQLKSAAAGPAAADDNQATHLREIVAAGRHLLTLIDEVLDLARVESGKLAVSPEPVALLPLMGECLALIRPQADARAVVLLEPPTACALHVQADRTRLKQVLLNLLSNAVKYNRHGGSVSLGCEPSPAATSPAGAGAGHHGPAGRLRIRIHDTGAGLTAEQAGRLFVPFERLDAEARHIQGTGIGLALSKRLVELMGGRVGVDSTPGTGSTFWVELPLADAPAEPGESTDSPDDRARVDAAPTAMRRTVLCVEDNPANLRLIEAVFAQRPGIRLLTAMAPGLGLELARTHRPALILLDINLPDMDGYAVMECLREHGATRDIPVVAVSANAMPRDLERARAAGFAAYLTKPLDIDRLLQLLDETLAASAGAGPGTGPGA